jgi:hypothetical protein
METMKLGFLFGGGHEKGRLEGTLLGCGEGRLEDILLGWAVIRVEWWKAYCWEGILLGCDEDSILLV